MGHALVNMELVRVKKQYLIDELGPAVDFMKLIKEEIDPKGIMNPGKIL